MLDARRAVFGDSQDRERGSIATHRWFAGRSWAQHFCCHGVLLSPAMRQSDDAQRSARRRPAARVPGDAHRHDNRKPRIAAGFSCRIRGTSGLRRRPLLEKIEQLLRSKPSPLRSSGPDWVVSSLPSLSNTSSDGESLSWANADRKAVFSLAASRLTLTTTKCASRKLRSSASPPISSSSALQGSQAALPTLITIRLPPRLASTLAVSRSAAGSREGRTAH